MLKLSLSTLSADQEDLQLLVEQHQSQLIDHQHDIHQRQRIDIRDVQNGYEIELINDIIVSLADYMCDFLNRSSVKYDVLSRIQQQQKNVYLPLSLAQLTNYCIRGQEVKGELGGNYNDTDTTTHAMIIIPTIPKSLLSTRNNILMPDNDDDVRDFVATYIQVQDFKVYYDNNDDDDDDDDDEVGETRNKTLGFNWIQWDVNFPILHAEPTTILKLKSEIQLLLDGELISASSASNENGNTIISNNILSVTSRGREKMETMAFINKLETSDIEANEVVASTSSNVLRIIGVCIIVFVIGISSHLIRQGHRRSENRKLLQQIPIREIQSFHGEVGIQQEPAEGDERQSAICMHSDSRTNLDVWSNDPN
jgi:hypothetical protein